jgi:hypothetical protein
MHRHAMLVDSYTSTQSICKHTASHSSNSLVLVLLYCCNVVATTAATTIRTQVQGNWRPHLGLLQMKRLPQRTHAFLAAGSAAAPAPTAQSAPAMTDSTSLTVRGTFVILCLQAAAGSSTMSQGAIGLVRTCCNTAQPASTCPRTSTHFHGIRSHSTPPLMTHAAGVCQSLEHSAGGMPPAVHACKGYHPRE